MIHLVWWHLRARGRSARKIAILLLLHVLFVYFAFLFISCLHVGVADIVFWRENIVTNDICSSSYFHALVFSDSVPCGIVPCLPLSCYQSAVCVVNVVGLFDAVSSFINPDSVKLLSFSPAAVGLAYDTSELSRDRPIVLIVVGLFPFTATKPGVSRHNVACSVSLIGTDSPIQTVMSSIFTRSKTQKLAYD